MVDRGLQIHSGMLDDQFHFIDRPPLTTTLLILPPLFSEKANGMDRFFGRNILIGVSCVTLGFITALVIDFPPTYVISIMFLIVGGAGILFLSR
jgi:ABC-type Mn2+/Zn2+ transport system permease subunit